MRKYLVIGVLALITLLSPFVGTTALQPLELLDPASMTHRIFFELRLPRTLLGFFAGGALALGGLLFQTLFRNALMTPYTLGVSSGAILGTGIAIKLGLNALFFGLAATALFGFIGALSTVALLLWLARFLPRHQSESLLLLGIALSFFYSAALMVLYYLSSFEQTHTIMRFTMGSLSVIGYAQPLLAVVTALAFWWLLWRMRFELQLLSLPNDQATLKGINTARTGKILLLGASVAIGVLVSICGPIGFVGLIVPHVVKMLWRQNVTRLIGPTFFTGGLFLVVCDTLARAVHSAGEIPIGIITALIGGPFFVYILLRGRT